MKKYQFDYDKLKALAKKKGEKMRDIASALGMSHNYFYAMNKQSGCLPSHIVYQMAELLDCIPTDFCIDFDGEIYTSKPIEECTEPKLEIRLDPNEMESEFELYVKAKLLDIYNNIREINLTAKANNEILMYLFNCKQQEENSKQYGDDSERAKNLLGKMLDSANGGSVKLDDFKRRLSVIGITSEDAIKEAISANNCKTDVYGYGNNKAVWIVEV